MNDYWIPNSLERKCLSHLDEPQNWTILKRERPREEDVLSWAPFRRIFLINLVQYTLILAVIFIGLASTSGSGPAGVREDLPIVVGFVAVFAVVLSAYVTHLYRRTWNRRARSLREE